MVWKRIGFVCSVRVQGLKITRACRLYGISRPTGYDWLKRFDISPERLIKDRSRRPHHSPNATPDVISQKILELWDESGWCTSSARMGHFGFQAKRQLEPMLIGLV